MCGICGILNYGNSTDTFDESFLVKMSDTLAHRGPDDSGTFLSPDRKVGFGFRRLAIVDLSPAGHQPMFTPDGSVALMMNGEIYNHLVLRKQLESKGYRYRSRSDTETVLYAYQEYGPAFVDKLLGMFAIAVWDLRNRRLVLARDRVGIKPLYYTFAGGNFLFGSEIKALLQHSSVQRAMDEEALEHYLTFLIPPAPMTLFRNIFKLEAGHRMTVSFGGETVNERYWEPVPGRPQPSIDLEGNPVGDSIFRPGQFSFSEENSVSTIRQLLRQSVKDRMMSDVPFGVFLSGGIDSSTNVALMAELMDRPVDTFSVGIRDLEKYNELGYARQIARQFKTNHREIIIDQRDAFEFLPKLIFHQDEPLADPVCIPLYFVSKLARESGTIVVQVGEGSDEQFAGYQWMLRELKFYRSVWRLLKSLPHPLGSVAHSTLSPLIRSLYGDLGLDYFRRAADGDELYWGGAVNFTETHKRSLINSGKRTAIGGPAGFVRKWHGEILERDPGADYLKRMIYLEFRNRLPELLLMRVDKVSMATSVEARVPFLDHRIVEFSMQIPMSQKIRNGEPKYIVKKAVEGIVPDNIIHRKKQGFAAPVNEWLRKDWYGFLESKLLQSYFVTSGYFNKDVVTGLLAAHRGGRRNEGQNLWNLLNLVLWHEQWIEGRSAA